MVHALPDLPPLIVLVGPTGVGKTALAMRIARHLGGEIVGADSRQIYHWMSIGTAKPTLEERRAVPHYLVDIIDPDEPFSLAMYLDAANAAIHDIAHRGQIPLLVGGTGQYLQAVVEGWQIPRVEPHLEIRSALEQRAVEEGVASLYAELQQVDPLASTIIAPNNLRRIIRALEVHTVTGQPISSQQRKAAPPYRITTIWLDLPREELYQRLDRRVDGMVAAGLLAEVKELLRRGYDWSLPAMSSLGYREWQPYFAGAATLAECTERLKFNTHNFVRKQASWFRRLPDTHRITAGPGALDEALGLVARPP